jgi:hypothetical protein
MDKKGTEQENWPEGLGAIQISEIALNLTNAHNWKFPGNDKIQNYWLKVFPATHRHITRNFNAIIEEPKRTSDWLTDTKIRRQQGS